MQPMGTAPSRSLEPSTITAQGYQLGIQKAHKHEHFIGISLPGPTLLGLIIRGFYGMSLSFFLLVCFLWGPNQGFAAFWGFRVQGFRVWGLRLKDLGFRAWGLGLGFRDEGM